MTHPRNRYIGLSPLGITVEVIPFSMVRGQIQERLLGSLRDLYRQ